MDASAAGLVPVHVGRPQPGSQREKVLLAQVERSAHRRSLRVPDGLDWQGCGLQPRWLGMETSDCAVAVQPSIFHNNGAAELDRFLMGARAREEPALAVVVIGDADDDSAPSPLSYFDSSVNLDREFTTVYGKRLPAGARPAIVPDLTPSDRDLAMRLLNRPEDAPWWSLELAGGQAVRGDGSGVETHEAQGKLHPILVDSLGVPVVAAWVPPAGDQRWYVIPDVPGWGSVLDWLIRQALPEHAPGVLRRVRSPFFTDPELQTTGEIAARQALEELEARYAAERQRLDRELGEAKSQAEPIRYGLLYGTGGQLVHAVAEVLAAAGMRAVDLDKEFGDTVSADLLVSRDGGAPRRLVEVKAASGAAGERLVADLERHLTTWPQLRPGEPVTGGVLVVNHQHGQHPAQRTPRVYSRPEFVAALRVTVVSTLQLFHWWRDENWNTIRASILGTADSTAHAEAPAAADSVAAAPPSRPRHWWSRGP